MEYGGGCLLLNVPGDFTKFRVVVAVFVEWVFLPFLEEFGTHIDDGCSGLGEIRFRVICDGFPRDRVVDIGRVYISICYGRLAEIEESMF